MLTGHRAKNKLYFYLLMSNVFYFLSNREHFISTKMCLESLQNEDVCLLSNK